jgi:hypothetical protein
MQSIVRFKIGDFHAQDTLVSNRGFGPVEAMGPGKAGYWRRFALFDPPPGLREAVPGYACS